MRYRSRRDSSETPRGLGGFRVFERPNKILFHVVVQLELIFLFLSSTMDIVCILYLYHAFWEIIERLSVHLFLT